MPLSLMELYTLVSIQLSFSLKYKSQQLECVQPASDVHYSSEKFRLTDNELSRNLGKWFTSQPPTNTLAVNII